MGTDEENKNKVLLSYASALKHSLNIFTYILNLS